MFRHLVLPPLGFAVVMYLGWEAFWPWNKAIALMVLIGLSAMFGVVFGYLALRLDNGPTHHDLMVPLCLGTAGCLIFYAVGIRIYHLSKISWFAIVGTALLGLWLFVEACQRSRQMIRSQQKTKAADRSAGLPAI